VVRSHAGINASLGLFFSSIVLAGVLLEMMSIKASGAPPVFLHASGRDIVNERNEKVRLRGVGLGNWMLPEGYMWKFGGAGDRPRRIEKIVSDLIGPEAADRFWHEYRQNYIAKADIKRMAELGYNSVRPALNARLFLTETDPPQPVPEGYELLDNLVKQCKAQGIYVIIDMHGAPGGQTGQNIDDSANDQPELFQQIQYQDRLVDLWRTIAQRYKDEPTVAGYDLLNEPLPERTGAAAKYKSQLEPLYQRITQAIRAVDQKHLIILEGYDWANDWSVFTQPFDKNLVYQFHYYCWDSPTQLKDISKYLAFGQRNQVPIWVGETGERDSTIYWATTEYFEANNIGWSFWPWKKMAAANAPYSINPPAHWSDLVAFSKGETKPPPAVAQQALAELLHNLRLKNCTYFPEVVNAMMRRAPVRIEAENYGQGGLNVAYGVTVPTNRSEFYRLAEPVAVTVSEAHPKQPFITLKATEWTVYTIDSSAAKKYSITLRVRAKDVSAEAHLVVGEQVFKVKAPPADWTEIRLNAVALNQGANQLKWIISQGTVDLDWLDVR